MERYIHHVDCPSFDEVDLDYRCGKSPLRRYCHPVDKKIIDVLDNPAINAVFRTVSDYVADQNFGQIIASATPVNTDGSTKIIIWIRTTGLIFAQAFSRANCSKAIYSNIPHNM